MFLGFTFFYRRRKTIYGSEMNLCWNVPFLELSTSTSRIPLALGSVDGRILLAVLWNTSDNELVMIMSIPKDVFEIKFWWKWPANAAVTLYFLNNSKTFRRDWRGIWKYESGTITDLYGLAPVMVSDSSSSSYRNHGWCPKANIVLHSPDGNPRAYSSWSCSHWNCFSYSSCAPLPVWLENNAEFNTMLYDDGVAQNAK